MKSRYKHSFPALKTTQKKLFYDSFPVPSFLLAIIGVPKFIKTLLQVVFFFFSWYSPVNLSECKKSPLKKHTDPIGLGSSQILTYDWIVHGKVISPSMLTFLCT